MALSVRRFRFLVSKYGVISCGRLVAQRVYRDTFQRAYYVLTLRDLPVATAEFEFPEWLSVSLYKQLSDVPTGFLEAFAEQKGGDELAHRLLNRFFERGASVSIASVDRQFAGYLWSVTQDSDKLFHGFYYAPLDKDEGVFVNGEVFEEYRGRGVFPLLMQRTCQLLAQQGTVNAQANCRVWNKSSLRAMRKAGLEIAGVASIYHIFHKRVVIWSLATRKETAQQEKHNSHEASSQPKGGI